MIYGQLMQQANLMAFIDAFRVFAISSVRGNVIFFSMTNQF